MGQTVADERKPGNECGPRAALPEQMEHEAMPGVIAGRTPAAPYPGIYPGITEPPTGEVAGGR